MANARNARSASAADFTDTNPYLEDGEIRVESDTRKTKTGPGYWTDLSYDEGATSGGSGPGWIEVLISTDEADWTNTDGAWTFAAGVVTATDTSGVATLALPGAKSALAGMALILPLTFTGDTNPQFTIGNPSDVPYGLQGFNPQVSAPDFLPALVVEGASADQVPLLPPVGQTVMSALLVGTYGALFQDGIPLISATEGSNGKTLGQSTDPVLILQNDGAAAVEVDLNTAHLYVLGFAF